MEGPSIHVLRPALKRRRNRETKSCWPCRDRKVRCDMLLPCGTCKKRNHPNLCQYGPRPPGSERVVGEATKTRRPSEGEQDNFIIYVPDQAHNDFEPLGDNTNDDEQSQATISPSEAVDPDLVPEDQPNERVPLIPILNNISLNLSESWETDPITKATTFLGRNSSPTFFRRLSKIHIYDLVPDDVSVESAFCLTNRTTLHPFGSLWTTVNVRLVDVLKALPELETCMRYYRSFQQTVKPFYPFLLDPEGFERRFCEFLQQYGETGFDDELSGLPRDNTFNDAAWFGLLFAVLASGCQFSDTTPRDRILRTRVFVVCAFECLRLANLYVLPSLEIIQCMLLIEMTLANDSNPGVANALLGLTVQQAQELGLHVKRSQLSEADSSQDEVHPLWRAVVFLDSIFSSAYDRRPMAFPQPSTPTTTPNNSLPIPTHPTTSSFHQIMHTLHTLKQTYQLTSAESPTSLTGITTIEPYLTSLSHLEEAARTTFLASDTSVSIQGTLEELVYTIYLHTFRARLARCAALSRGPNGPTPELRREFFARFGASLREVVRAWLALRRLAPGLAVGAWDLLHQVVGAALLLAGMETVMKMGESGEVVGKFVRALGGMGEGVEGEGKEMVEVPFRHGLESLRYLVAKWKG